MKKDTCRYLVVGAGVTGESVVSYLLANDKNIKVMDSRELPPNAKKISDKVGAHNVHYGELNQRWLLDADVIVLSPGVDVHTREIQTAIEHGIEVIGDIELFSRNATKPYLAITGSNGKSTVTTLVTEILKSQGIHAKAGANIGEPALDLIQDDSVEMYVLELSSFQLEICQSIRPEAAVVLNISEDHLDRHATYDEYFNIKMSIYDNAKTRIIPRNTTIKTRHATSFGLDTPPSGHYGIISDNEGEWLAHGQKKLLNTALLRLIGDSGKLNALAALALAEPYIKNWGAALEVLTKFNGLPHRCQLVFEYGNVQWIDDSKGTNIGATVAAIKGLERPIILLLGGLYKGGDLDELVSVISDKVTAVIVFGKDRDIFNEALSGVVNTSIADSLEDAVLLASRMSQNNDVVLFSPACASFDMFSNYKERGIAFQKLAKKYGASHGG